MCLAVLIISFVVIGQYIQPNPKGSKQGYIEAFSKGNMATCHTKLSALVVVFGVNLCTK